MTETVVDLKTQAVEILDSLGAREMELVLDYLQKLLAEQNQKAEVRARKIAAFEHSKTLCTKVDLPPDFDYKKELGKILAEKYESLG